MLFPNTGNIVTAFFYSEFLATRAARFYRKCNNFFLQCSFIFEHLFLYILATKMLLNISSVIAYGTTKQLFEHIMSLFHKG